MCEPWSCVSEKLIGPLSCLQNTNSEPKAKRRKLSRKGNCWDNACSETLFGSLKVERLHGQRFATIREAKDEVLAWLLWYNRTRMHSTLNYVSPVQFEIGRAHV